MTVAAVAVDLLEPADVGGDDAAEVALDDHFVLKQRVDLTDLLGGQLVRLDVAVDLQLFNDFQRLGRADAVDVTKREFDPLVSRNIDTDDARHFSLPSFVEG